MRLIFAAGGAAAAAAALALAGPASAGPGRPAPRPRAGQQVPASSAVRLRGMPAGTVAFGRDSRDQLTARADVYGLTPGSSHDVQLEIPGRPGPIGFSPLAAGSTGQASAVLHSSFTGALLPGSRLLIRMGVGSGRAARRRIAETRLLSGAGGEPNRLIATDVSSAGASAGRPRGRATIAYSASRHTLTVTVHASGLTPGLHAAHIHLGSCRSQGPVRYTLADLAAGRQGEIRHAVRVITNVTAPIPASGWYLNIHQGNSGNIVRNGQPSIFFRPLLCADIGMP